MLYLLLSSPVKLREAPYCSETLVSQLHSQAVSLQPFHLLLPLAGQLMRLPVPRTCLPPTLLLCTVVRCWGRRG
jgi:hypothetical protein